MNKRLILKRMSDGTPYYFTHSKYNKNGNVYVGEHRRKAEEVLGRALKSSECVHHINGNTLDNRNFNLLICTSGYHRYLHSKLSKPTGNPPKIFLTILGITKSLIDWSKLNGIRIGTLRYRLNNDWSVEELFNKPNTTKKRRRKNRILSGLSASRGVNQFN